MSFSRDYATLARLVAQGNSLIVTWLSIRLKVFEARELKKLRALETFAIEFKQEKCAKLNFIFHAIYVQFHLR